MDIKIEDLDRIVGHLLEGIRQVSSPSSIRRVILEVKDLGEMIETGDVVGELATRLDEALDEYPVLVRERRDGKPAAGDYVVKLGAYVGGKFVFNPEAS